MEKQSSPRFFAPRRYARLLSLCGLLGLASCGGGVSVGGSYGDGGFYVGGGIGYEFDFTRPSVSIAVAEGEVRPGQQIRIAAAASDESGIESVTLYRVDLGGDRLVGSLFTRPYEWAVVVPSDGRGSVTYYVQARDNAGNRANSSAVTIAIRP